jgi:hypothetical protein
MAAVRKSLEADEMRGQRGNNVLLRLNRNHRIIFTAEDEGRTLDVRQCRKKIEGATFSIV